MTREEAKAMVTAAMRRALKHDRFTLDDDADLLALGMLDSLDSMVFLLELSKLSGREFPEQDLEEKGFFKVAHLLDFLTA